MDCLDSESAMTLVCVHMCVQTYLDSESAMTEAKPGDSGSEKWEEEKAEF